MASKKPTKPAAAAKTSKKPAAPALTITADCERDADGFGALPLSMLLFDSANSSIDRTQIAGFKTRLLQAGFEALEVLCYADEPRRCDDWDPRNDGDVDVSDEWALVAVLKVADDE